MHPSVDELAQRALHLYNDKKSRVLILIGGAPGSGKTTLATEVARRVSKFLGEGQSIALPMDGFHYYRHQLLAMDNPEEAIARRGAPFTFDVERILQYTRRLVNSNEPVLFPSFDHALKDPLEDAIKVDESVKIIFFEGNYLLMNEPVWAELYSLATETWLVKASAAEIRDRLANRHLRAGLVDTLEDGYKRADMNDIPNGEYMLSHLGRVDVNVDTSSVDSRSKQLQ
ncbi:hypothetical protein CANCADRAFT_115244 [Tortispora caseinolytica NRRL Y-17796]|uniref:Zeta toxin domain-containing protein n=1 Tax=Tortispora caseinolytica NRRL Y-17796 TaxID=767744 RepID=A0A1E4TGW0_9ASCO|nr:hypothetical protein CANCADRAFT_115244 [Tortispora caseinolytica NRRL Y-17796]